MKRPHLVSCIEIGFHSYFGGSLEHVSLDGWGECSISQYLGASVDFAEGTDVYLRLPKLVSRLSFSMNGC